ncbi:MAG: hypothetical protein KDC57_01150 [Saprospiraceae bacterium]|nr:hypothetical protein [Saprospiraceae bacterium]
MKHDFTPNDLVRFLYHETSQEETVLLQQALIEDQELMTQYVELEDGKNALPSAAYRPSLSSIDRILKYSSTVLSPATL